MKEGLVLRIERISPNDGNGLRTVVFLKGCPLRCEWCSTPESQSGKPEWFYKLPKCRHCGTCMKVCPQGALRPSTDMRSVVRDPSKCINCFKCADVCITHAIGAYGQRMTVKDVMKEIDKDSIFYFHSKGGVTLSGGDILRQADFAQAILMECKDECLNTAAEMDMFGPYENVQKLIPYLNSYFVDVKLIDEEAHKKWTGVSNQSIIRNIKLASEEFPKVPMNVRLPLIPGVNDSEDNIKATAEFCKGLPSCKSLEFLPFHRLGASSYEYTQRIYKYADQEAMTFDEAYEKVKCILGEAYPFDVKISGKVVG